MVRVIWLVSAVIVEWMTTVIVHQTKQERKQVIMEKIKASEAVLANLALLAEAAKLEKSIRKAKEDLKGFQQENLAALLIGARVGKYNVSVKPAFKWSVSED